MKNEKLENQIVGKFLKDWLELMNNLEKSGVSTPILMSCFLEVCCIGLTSAGQMFTSQERFEDFLQNDFMPKVSNMAKEMRKVTDNNLTKH